MTRTFDLLAALFGLIFGLPLLLALLVAGYLDTGSPVFRQVRVGRYRKPFVLVKFRTMRPDTASVATHLADASAVTPLGHFLRRSKLDELPQLWNVLKGDMSLVGPRPCLFSQEVLIAERWPVGYSMYVRVSQGWLKFKGSTCPLLTCWLKRMPTCCKT